MKNEGNTSWVVTRLHTRHPHYLSAFPLRRTPPAQRYRHRAFNSPPVDHGSRWLSYPLSAQRTRIASVSSLLTLIPILRSAAMAYDLVPTHLNSGIRTHMVWSRHSVELPPTPIWLPTPWKRADTFHSTLIHRLTFISSSTCPKCSGSATLYHRVQFQDRHHHRPISL
jgi:hypothetical protein